jgi:uncharacterized protein (TIGR02300 family)
MASKAARGTKRTCQNPECGARFYDLNRNPIVCPICESAYTIASQPLVAEESAEEKAARRPRKPEVVPEKVAPAETAETEEALADIEEGDETIVADDDETFIEEEEEAGDDVSGIIGGPVAEGEEEP